MSGFAVRYVVTPNPARLTAGLDRPQHAQRRRASLMPACEQVRVRTEWVQILRLCLPLHVFPKVLSQPMAEHVHDIRRQFAPIWSLEVGCLLGLARPVLELIRVFRLDLR